MLINKKNMLSAAVVMASLVGTAGIAQAAPVTTTTVGGYVKFDSIYSEENDSAASSNTLREQALLTLNGSEADGEEGELYMAAYESRLKFTSQTTGTPVGDLKAVIEGDFYSGGTQNIVNLRHAYFTQDNLTIGQTWSTFMDLGSLAETADFGGPAGRIFTRQSLVRYTINAAGGKLELALESPKNGVGAEKDASTPDMIAKYTVKTDFGYVAAGALVQNLQYDDGTDSDSAIAVAARVSGRINIGSDNLKFAVISGQAMGGYLNFGDVAAASIVDGKIEMTEQTAVRVSYQHVWSPGLRSSVRYALTTSDFNGQDQGDFSSLHANLVYNPYKPVKFGAEIISAKKDVAEEESRKLSRFHLFAKYAF